MALKKLYSYSGIAPRGNMSDPTKYGLIKVELRPIKTRHYWRIFRDVNHFSVSLRLECERAKFKDDSVKENTLNF